MYQGFYLTEKKGNNAFSYEKRKSPQLWVPERKKMSLDELWKRWDEEGCEFLLEGKEEDRVVFEDEDENGVLQSCKGMKYFVETEFEGVPLFLFDNHNHALFFWYEAFVKGQLERGAKLVHVDQHKDMRKPERALGAGEFMEWGAGGVALEKMKKYVNEDVNVGNYIVPALEEGLLSDVQLLTGESGLEASPFLESENMILNLDLDFFAPELGKIDFEKARTFIREHAKRARLITVATSPFFIDQVLALKLFEKLFTP
jgi:hypothetical protein